MIDNLIQNQGIDITVVGLIVTFTGLALVALMIYFFNLSFSFLKKPGKNRREGRDDAMLSDKENPEKLNDEELAAIAAAIDVYRRLHFDIMPSEMVFERGDPQTPWKMVYKYISRFQRLR